MRAYSRLCLPIRNRLLWLPHCAEGRTGEEGWLAFAQQTRSFLRSSVCSVRACWGLGAGRAAHVKTVDVSVPLLTSGSVGKTIFSSFRYTSMLHMHCPPPPPLCVRVCVFVCARVHACACTHKLAKHQPLCMYSRVCLHCSSDGARGGV